MGNNWHSYALGIGKFNVQIPPDIVVETDSIFAEFEIDAASTHVNSTSWLVAKNITSQWSCATISLDNLPSTMEEDFFTLTYDHRDNSIRNIKIKLEHIPDEYKDGNQNNYGILFRISNSDYFHNVYAGIKGNIWFKYYE